MINDQSKQMVENNEWKERLALKNSLDQFN